MHSSALIGGLNVSYIKIPVPRPSTNVVKAMISEPSMLLGIPIVDRISLLWSGIGSFLGLEWAWLLGNQF